MAKITDYSYRSSDDRNTQIHAIKWEPDNGEVIATLQLVHGMQEYIERYSEYAEYMADHGFAVFGHDHIGHGYSVERSEDRGIMHCKHPDDVMIEDMYSNYRIIKEQYPDKPYFILGHSMGSYLLRKYLCVHSEEDLKTNGAVIMGTGSVNDVALIFGRAIWTVIAAIKGRNGRSSILPKLMFSASYKQFDLTGEHPENSWLSKNIENVKAFSDPADERNNCVFSVNGYEILLRSTYFDNRMKNIKKMNRNIPILFISGDQDPVGDMGVGVKTAYGKFQKAGIKDLTLKLFAGDRHEILNELDRSDVYEYLYNWMKNRV